MTMEATATKTLQIVVSHTLAPITTQQLRLAKGVEDLYYVLLYTSRPAYRTNPDAWRDWVEMGFHVAIKSPPPATADQDAVTVRVRSAGKAPEISMVGADGETLERLQVLLKRIDGLRRAVAGKGDEAKAQAVLGDAEVEQLLTRPMTEALDACGLSAGERGKFLAAIRRAVVALTHDEVSSIGASFN